MILDCCQEEKNYLRFYGLLAQWLTTQRPEYVTCFELCFTDSYKTIHNLETNKLWNAAKFYAHLLQADAISWTVLKCIRLTVDDTTSNMRIFIKILLTELFEHMGIKDLCEWMSSPDLQESLKGIFPKDSV